MKLHSYVQKRVVYTYYTQSGARIKSERIIIHRTTTTTTHIHSNIATRRYTSHPYIYIIRLTRKREVL